MDTLGFLSSSICLKSSIVNGRGLALLSLALPDSKNSPMSFSCADLIVKYKASIFDYLCEKYRQAPITDKDWERLTHYLEAKYLELLKKNKP